MCLSVWIEPRATRRVKPPCAIAATSAGWLIDRQAFRRGKSPSPPGLRPNAFVHHTKKPPDAMSEGLVSPAVNPYFSGPTLSPAAL